MVKVYGAFIGRQFLQRALVVEYIYVQWEPGQQRSRPFTHQEPTGSQAVELSRVADNPRIEIGRRRPFFPGKTAISNHIFDGRYGCRTVDELVDIASKRCVGMANDTVMLQYTPNMAI